jgi:lipopolysaccharide/colanic/teichoic acid biosynthesis glycosyltransferase
MKRIFDIVFSIGGIVILSPFFILFWILIKLESKGDPIFKQLRVGKNNIDFKLYKFRTMFPDSERKGSITIGGRDPRVTRVGYYLRKFKVDELPQLFNVLKGDMSFVGPRPEVRKYVELYSKEQLKVLTIQPGITDYASIKYFNENEILGNSPNPEHDYINIIMPEKLKLNIEYLHDNNFLRDIRIILITVLKIFVR